MNDELYQWSIHLLDTIDTLDTRVRRFFTDARKTKPDTLDEEYTNIHSAYKLALDDADEKVSMASQIYDLVNKVFINVTQELCVTCKKLQVQIEVPLTS